MRLLIAIGYESHESAAAPFSVYVGRKHEEMVKAMEASTAVRFEIVKNPTVLRKRAAVRPSLPEVDLDANDEAGGTDVEEYSEPWTEDKTSRWFASLKENAKPVSPEAAALDADDEAADTDDQTVAAPADDEAAATETVADPAPVSGKRKR